MSKKLNDELLRSSQYAKISGVCAGLAIYLGWEIWVVRVLVVAVALVGMAPLVIVAYIAAWFIFDTDESVAADARFFNHDTHNKSKQYSPDEYNGQGAIKVKSKIWQAGFPPKQALQEISQKLTVLDEHISAIENYVTSDEFNLDREINKL